MADMFTQTSRERARATRLPRQPAGAHRGPGQADRRLRSRSQQRHRARPRSHSRSQQRSRARSRSQQRSRARSWSRSRSQQRPRARSRSRSRHPLQTRSRSQNQLRTAGARAERGRSYSPNKNRLPPKERKQQDAPSTMKRRSGSQGKKLKNSTGHNSTTTVQSASAARVLPPSSEKAAHASKSDPVHPTEPIGGGLDRQLDTSLPPPPPVTSEPPSPASLPPPSSDGPQQRTLSAASHPAVTSVVTSRGLRPCSPTVRPLTSSVNIQSVGGSRGPSVIKRQSESKLPAVLEEQNFGAAGEVVMDLSGGEMARHDVRSGRHGVVRVRPCTAESAKNALNSSKFSVNTLFEGLHPMYPPTNMESQHGPHCHTFARAFEPLLWYYRCLGLLNVSVDADECFEITVNSTIVYVIYFFVHMSGFLHFVKGMMECLQHVQGEGVTLFDSMVHTHLAGTVHLITVGTAFITLYHVRAFPDFFNKIQETVTELSGLPTTNGVLRAQRRLALVIIVLLMPLIVLWCACAALAVFNDRKTTDLAIFNPWWSYVYIPVMMSNLALETFSFTFYLFFGMLIARYVVCIGEAIRRLEGIVSAHQVRHLHRMHVQIVTAQRLLLSIFGTHVLISMAFATVVVVYVVFHSVEVYELMARGTPPLVLLPVVVPHVWMLVVSWMHLYIPCYVSDMARDQFCEINNLLAQIETNDDPSLEKAISRYQQQITRDVALVNVGYFKLGRPALISAFSTMLTYILILFAIWKK